MFCDITNTIHNVKCIQIKITYAPLLTYVFAICQILHSIETNMCMLCVEKFKRVYVYIYMILVARENKNLKRIQENRNGFRYINII